MATVAPLSNVDRTSALLIAQLTLDDINDLRGSTISDQEYALQLMAEEFAQVLLASNEPQSAGNTEDPLEIPSPVESSSSNALWEDLSEQEISPPSSPSGASEISSLGDILSDEPQDSAPTTPVDAFDDDDSVQPKPSQTCVICTDSFVYDSRLTTRACHHRFCGSCLEQYIKTCIDNEHMMPPRCCGQVISFTESQHSSSVESLIQSLDEFDLGIEFGLGARLQAKVSELAVLPKDRLYCPNPGCTVFIGSWSSLKRRENSYSSKYQHICSSCLEHICILCKNRAHPGTPCKSRTAEEEAMDAQVRNLAHENSWQTCPGCGEVVERTYGCHHLICRCQTQFCYGCGALWETTCPCRS